MTPTARWLILVTLLLACDPTLLGADKGVCNSGQGEFEKKVDGSKIRLEPASGGQAGECQLRVSRKGREILTVTAPSIRIDALGIDLNGDGVRDLAFQANPVPRGDCCSTYYVFSFGENPHLLRKIEHGQFFRLEDRDYDRQPEIWGGDAEAFQSFDGLVFSKVLVVPTVVMRLERDRLIDAGPEFQFEFDILIARIRAELSPERIQAFRASDGRLAAGSAELDPTLRETKAMVLRIAWAYLYSGREKQAWKTLGELWPPADMDRIRALIQQKRGQGVLAQIDGTAPPREATGCESGFSLPAGFQKVGGGVTAPKATSFKDPEYTEEARAAHYQGTVVLWVIVGCDGKPHGIRVVRSAGRGLDEKAIEAVWQWKFEPARKDGVPVAVQANVEVNFRLYN